MAAVLPTINYRKQAPFYKETKKKALYQDCFTTPRKLSGEGIRDEARVTDIDGDQSWVVVHMGS